MNMIVQTFAVSHQDTGRLFFNRSRHPRMIRGPSSNSEISKESQSTVLEADVIAWLSAANVLLTALGIL